MFKYPTPDPVLYRQLLSSYRRCLKNKPHVKGTAFHFWHESIVYQLALEIQNRTYRPGQSNIFVVTQPKPREVIAAQLRDRIVHHFIHDYMAPFWERRFAPQSYACRPGKGPLRACDDLAAFIRSYQRQNRAPLFYLKVDVQNFFNSIDRRILENLVTRHLEHPLYTWLCQVVIRHRPTAPGAFVLTSPKRLWQTLPPYKSMFRAAPDIGLPVGNLTSQFFANIYMDRLDQHITHRLKGRCRYWQRYVDDLVFLGEDREALASLVPAIDGFLRDELRLMLNPRKTLLQPLARGLDHLGYFFKPSHRTVRRRVVGNAERAVAELSATPPGAASKPGSISPDVLAATARLNSYLGHYGHAASRQARESLVAKMLEAPEWRACLAVAPQATSVYPIRPSRLVLGEIAARREHVLKRAFRAALRDGDAEAARRREALYLKGWCAMAEWVDGRGWAGEPLDGGSPAVQEGPAT